MDHNQARQALAQPLQFGNVTQIKALKLIYPPEPEPTPEGKKRYKVNIEVSFDDVIYVVAEDEEEAREMALEAFDLGDCDIDISVTPDEEI